jgi:tetratricopeptide (TPR) repeat protein
MGKKGKGGSDRKRKRGPKKPEAGGGPRPTSTGRGPGPEGIGVPPGRGAMERSMAEISRLIGAQQFDSVEDATRFVEAQLTGRLLDEHPAGFAPYPLAAAQAIMYEAWDVTSPRERIRLAETALEVSPDCADAYTLLAEEKARSVEEALALLEKGVRAGERALRPEAFEEDVGHFWGLLETRPYMRARAGLADCLWLLGKREEAVAHAEDLLRLNPSDNQGIRYALLQWVVETGDDDAVKRLLGRYQGEWSSSWLYTRALWVFRKEGESPGAQEALAEALEQNSHVPPYLVGERRVPSRLPDYVGLGDESEAKAYAREAGELWRRTDGARGWLLRSRGRLS